MVRRRLVRAAGSTTIRLLKIVLQNVCIEKIIFFTLLLLQGIFDFLVDAKVIYQEIHTFTHISLWGIQRWGLLEIVKLIMVITILVLRMLNVIVIVQRRSLWDSLQLARMSWKFILVMMPSLLFPLISDMPSLRFIMLNFLTMWINLSAVLRRGGMMICF